MPQQQKLFPGFDISKELNHEDEEVRKKFVFSIGPESPLSLEECLLGLYTTRISWQPGMKYADEKGAQKVARSIQANARRPSENGLGNVGAVADTAEAPVPNDASGKEQAFARNSRLRQGTWALDTTLGPHD